MVSQYIFSSSRIVVIIINVITLVELEKNPSFCSKAATLGKIYMYICYVIHDEAIQLTFCTCCVGISSLLMPSASLAGFTLLIFFVKEKEFE